MGGKCLAGRGMPGSAARLSCLSPAAGKSCPFSPQVGAAGTRPTPPKGGKWHARPARPVLLEGLASSEAHGVMRERAAVDNRGVQRVRGPGPEAKGAAGGEPELAPPGLLAGDFTPHRAGTSLGSFELESLVLGPQGQACAGCVNWMARLR